MAGPRSTFAAWRDHAEVTRLLKERGARVTLTDASCLGDVEQAQEAIWWEAVDINSRGADGRTPLMCAAKSGHYEVVKLLLNEGADVRARTVDGGTALQMAQAQGYKAIAELLAKHGAKE